MSSERIAHVHSRRRPLTSMASTMNAGKIDSSRRVVDVRGVGWIRIAMTATCGIASSE